METIIFIYHKDGVLKSLSLDQSTSMASQLVLEGWEHTATLNPCTFIDYLFNQCDESDVFNEIKELASPIHKSKP